MGLGIALGLMTMPEPEGMPEAAMTFMNGIMTVGYFFPLLKLTETVGGFFLLIGRGAPAALVILAPVTLNIFLYHLFLTPGVNELALPGLMGTAHIVAMTGYWNLYKPLFGKGK